MTILFIGYYFNPYPGVGAQRISYWADEISKHGIQPTVITTIEQEGKKPYPVHIVANTSRKRMLSSFIQDVGYSWELDIIDFINKSDLPNFSYALISGGPFMQMGISSYLKDHFPGIKIILDFRDPFGNNPRALNESIIKRKIKQYFEAKFIKLTAKSIVVNSCCKKLIKNNSEVVIIENGFDERLIPDRNYTTTQTDFIYTGKLYWDVSLIPFINVIIEHSFSFSYYGSSPNLDDYASKKISINSPVDYNKVLLKIADSDVTVLFTSGEAFESTTKIFDYIALNKKILVITEGEPKTGSLHEITKNYPNIVWSENNQEAIKMSIKELKTMEVNPFDASSFSRKSSLKKLVTLLKSI